MSMRVTTSVRRGLGVTSDKVTNVVRWIFFSVCISVVPIVYNYLDLILHKKSVDLNAVLARGDLILVTIVLLADAIGELVVNNQVKKPINISISGSSYIILLVSCLLFARVSSADPQTVNKNFILFYSLVCFSWMLIIGATCKWLKET